MNPRPESLSQPTRRKVVFGAMAGLGRMAMLPPRVWGADDSGLTHGADAIHQENVFQATRKRIYEALTDATQFDQWMRLSAAMKSGATAAAPAQVSREAGGAFSVFGGYVTGRQIELVPNERIVQAWRPQSWKPGEYSVVKFELVEQGNATKIILDHKGFPDGTGPHLAAGWKLNYWSPLQEYFSSQK